MANRFLSNITINDSYTFPSADGTNGQIITTDGSGNLSFNDTSSLYGTKSNYVYYDVKNSSGATINKGTAVMATGTDGNSGHILIAPMVADGTVEPKFFMGVLESTLGNGEIGRVIHFGQLSQFDTNDFEDGDVLWCDPANPGGYTVTEPEGPNLKIAAAIVINSATNGKIKVRVQGNAGLHELHDVKINTQANGDLLQWNNTLGVWENKTLASIADARYVNVSGDTVTGTITFENGIRVGSGSHGTSANTAAITFGEGDPTTDSMYLEYDGEGLSGDNNALFIRTSKDDSTLATFKLGGDIELTSNAWSIGAGGTFTTSGSVAIGPSTPSNTLHVYKNATIGAISDTTVANAGLRIQDSGASMYFDGNSIVLDNTGYITTNGAHDLVLGTNSTARIHIDNTGFIGIGETNPQSKLHVVGSTLIDSGSLTVSSASYTQISVDQTDSAAIIMGVSSGSTEGFVNVVNNGDNHLTNSPELKLLLNSTRYATLTTTGLGIGTDNPGHKLDVEDSVNGEAILLRLNNTFDDNDPASAPLVSMFMNAASNNGYLRVYGAPANAAAKHQFDIGATAGTSFMTFSPNNTERMRITAGGLVGINTDDPQAKLDVNGVVALGNGTQDLASDADLTIRVGNEFAGLDFKSERTSGNIGGLRWYDSNNVMQTQLLVDVNGSLNYYDEVSGVSRLFINGSNSVVTVGSHIAMQEDHYVNYRFEMDGVDNTGTVYILLCLYAGGNDVNGTITMDRTSGLRHAARIDILISSGSSALPVGGLRAFGTSGSGDPEYNLVTCDYSGNTYVAVEIRNPDLYYETTGAYFTGRIKSTGGFLIPKKSTEVSNVTAYENNCEHVFQGNAGFRDGNLGVGTTNPTDKLEVVGTGKFGEDAGVDTSAVIKLRDSGDGMIAAVRTGIRTWAHNIYSDGHYAIRNVDDSTNVLTLSDDNRVGINRGDPSYTLDVNGSCRIGGASTGTEFRIEATDTAGAPAATATIRMVGYEGRGIGTFYQDVSYAGEWFSGLRYNGGFGTYHIGFDETGGQAEYAGSSKLSVDVNGKVLMPGTLGVGTSNPQARLHVIAPSSSTDEVFQEWSYTADTQDKYSLMLKQTVTSGVVRYNFSMVNDNTAYDNVLVLDRGKVGIGQTTPAEKLEVIGNIQAYKGSGNNAKIRLNVSNVGSPQIDMSDNAGDNYWAVGADDADNFFKIHGSTTSMPIINNISTGAFLTVNQSGTLTMTGDVVAYSDERLKENVQTIDSALDKVLSMRGVYYNRIDLEDKRRKVGVIAQEVEKVLPEVVSKYSEDNDTRAVDYGKMVGVLIEAIKEQQKQIEELKAIINKK
jgi:hypothetical protein